jgi:hypothetical protein
MVGVGALHRPEQHHAGVVDEDVQPAEVLVGVGDERTRLRLARGDPRACNFRCTPRA